MHAKTNVIKYFYLQAYSVLITVFPVRILIAVASYQVLCLAVDYFYGIGGTYFFSGSCMRFGIVYGTPPKTPTSTKIWQHMLTRFC